MIVFLLFEPSDGKYVLYYTVRLKLEFGCNAHYVVTVEAQQETARY